MPKPKLVAFDFESAGIQAFPDYPPRPTMLGIYEKGKKPYYMSWGHSSGNNSTEEKAKAVLKKYWDDPAVELVAQNIAFDMAIAVKHWGFGLHRQGVNHDTMVQAFLLEPHAATFSLKPTAAKYLDLPPDEQDAVHDWLVANGVVTARQKDWGAHISECPAEIVGPYCIGDVERTMQLFELFTARLKTAGMDVAYARELKLIPIMLENTLAGVKVDVKRLKADVELYSASLEAAELMLFKELKSPHFNVDSDEELADAIDKAYPGLKWAMTKTGKRSTSKANMAATLEGITGKLGALLQYRASIATCLNTFMKPWLQQALAGDGRMRCQWNTTRSDTAGARTGRLSSTPSLMNIPTLTSAKFAQAIELHEKWLAKLGLAPLPNVRCYLLADAGDVLVSFDFASQELRTLAHYEDGILLQAYRDDPAQDLHQFAADLISEQIGKPFGRKQAKTCIAKGQLVLTQLGLVPIEEITGLHLVWDGVEWVKHTGVINKGTKQVIEYSGLCATPDHEVWTNEHGKIKFGDAAGRGTSLVKTGNFGQAVRYVEGNKLTSLAQSRKAWRQGSHILGSGVSVVWATGMEVVRQSWGRVLDAVSQLQYNQVQASAGPWGSVPRYSAALSDSTLSGIQMVWGTRDSMQVSVSRGVREVYRAGVSSRELQRPAYRPQRQRRALRAWEFAFGNQRGEFSQQNIQPTCKVQGTASQPDTSVALTENRLPKDGTWACTNDKEACRRDAVAGRSEGSAKSRWTEVYDISNAGPRNRFTVSGCLVSNCAFAILYGSGQATLAAQLGSSLDEAKEIKGAYLNALPGVASLIASLKQRAKLDQPIRTWGGRVYFVEPPKMVDGRLRTFDYKLLNYLCQGSAADLTKEALVRYHEVKQWGKITVTVHDQVVISVPKKHWKTEAEILRKCMEGLELDAKLLVDGSFGPNLHDLEDF